MAGASRARLFGVELNNPPRGVPCSVFPHECCRYPYVGRDYKLVEEGTGRRFRRGDLTAARPGGDTRYEWRVKKHAAVRERWVADLEDEHLSPARGWEYRGVRPYKGRYWAYSKANMEQFAREGRLRHTYEGMPEYKRYLDEMPGVALQDLWTDVPAIGSGMAERLGYPTQKPRALLERIIAASSNEGDLVLDPFCGCGTTVDAARRLRRRWAGIDISAFAIDLVRDQRLKDPTIPTVGIPADLEGARKLATEQPFAFESWAVTRLPGFAPNTQQRGDGGIDGRATLALAPDDTDSRLALAQVKGGKFSVSYLRDFRHVIDREQAALGCFVTLDPPPPKHRGDVKTAGQVHIAGQPYDRLHLWSMADYFDQRWPPLPVMTDPYSGRPLDQPGLF